MAICLDNVCLLCVSHVSPQIWQGKTVPLQMTNGTGKGSEDSMNIRSFCTKKKNRWRTEWSQREVTLLLQAMGITQEKVFACTVRGEVGMRAKGPRRGNLYLEHAAQSQKAAWKTARGKLCLCSHNISVCTHLYVLQLTYLQKKNYRFGNRADLSKSS